MQVRSISKGRDYYAAGGETRSRPVGGCAHTVQTQLALFETENIRSDLRSDVPAVNVLLQNRGEGEDSGALNGYHALRNHAAWMDLSARGKIHMAGEDRARLLHAMSTQQIQSLQPGQGAYAFFLNAQGRILGDANVFCFEDHFLIDTEPETRAKLFEHIERYIIADDVTLEDVTDRIATIAIEGPESASVLSSLHAPRPQSDFETAAWGARLVARVSSTGLPGYFIFLPAEAKSDLLGALNSIPQASPDEARIVRIENGRPRYGEEITERYLVQETGRLDAVNFNKGCYLGQEIVERVRSRAQIHRVLRKLEIEAAVPPDPGTKLKSGDAEAAEIASTVYSPALAKTIAMAYVRIPFSEPGAEIISGDMKAKVVP